jgi:hypothetical protein
MEGGAAARVRGSPTEETPMSDAVTALPALHDASLLRTDALLGGEWVPGPSRFAVHNPANGGALAEVSSADAWSRLIGGLAVRLSS